MTWYFNILLALALSASLQGDIPFTAIEKAFSSQDAQEIVHHGKDKMLISVLGKEGVYSHAQAVLVLKDFFNKKPPVSFKFVFKGKESSSGCFAMGNYETKSETLRVTIQFTKISAEQKIESLKIEKN